MDKIKLIFNTKNLYLALTAYFFAGYIYPTFLRDMGTYTYIIEYLGIYEKVLWVFILGYAFTTLMRNPIKKSVLRIRLYFFVILSVALGYLYLLEQIQILKVETFENLESIVMNIGVLNINLGYMEVYTFLKLYPLLKNNLFMGILLFIIFLSVIIIGGKFIKGCILLVFNFFKGIIEKQKEKKLQEEREKAEEEQRKLEQEIQEEIKNIQRVYGEPEMESLEDEKKEEENDISIQITQKERDPSTDGL